MSPRVRLLFLITLLLAVSGVFAQRFRRRDDSRDYNNPRAYTEAAPPAPWEKDGELPKDVFTFARVRYTSGWQGSRTAGVWHTDWPDADLNLSYRLQQVTSLKVEPNGRIIDIMDPELFHYPFIYIVEPGRLQFTDEEVKQLRRYFQNGGFLMVDDFWGEVQWQNWYDEIKRVLPEREVVDLPMDHPIFLGVLPLKVPKQELQIPNVYVGARSRETGVTWEYHDGEECKEPHFRGIYDDKHRLMVVMCHNTDNGDGWEREGEDHYYFEQFSEKRAYPLMINIIFYAMTH